MSDMEIDDEYLGCDEHETDKLFPSLPFILNGELFIVREIRENNSISAECVACTKSGKDTRIEGSASTTSIYRRHYKVCYCTMNYLFH